MRKTTPMLESTPELPQIARVPRSESSPERATGTAANARIKAAPQPANSSAARGSEVPRRNRNSSLRDFTAAAIAGTISFLANIATFAVMTTPAKAQDAPRPVPIAAPFPGFVDPYSRTPIVGYTPGESQIRLANMRDEGTVTNYIHIYGLDEKKFLGAVQIDVPAKASVGVEPHLLLQTLAPVDWRQPIVLYVENGREKQLWQHLKQNPRTGAMEDASVCTTSPHIDYAPVRHVILNATIARVGYLTSGISVHNFSDVTGQFEARMTDAGTGESLGKVELVIEPRSTFTQTALWYFDNTDIRWFRAPDLSGSINIEFVPKSPDAGARLSVQHRVFDYTRDGSVNLSNPCAITGGTIAIPPLPAPQ